MALKDRLRAAVYKIKGLSCTRVISIGDLVKYYSMLSKGF